MTVKIMPSGKDTPSGKLADAELHFADGPLAGLKLVGFSIWQRQNGRGYSVTFPARRRLIRLSGGRTWWAHFEFTRINITPTILPKKIEELRILRVICLV